MQLIDLALHIPNFVPEEICDKVIDFYESQGKNSKFFEQSYNQKAEGNVKSSGLCFEVGAQDGVYDDIHNYSGKGIVKWLEYIDSFGCFEPHTLGILTQCSHKYRIIKYSEGMNIHQHADVGDGILGKTIRGSCTLNFSDVNDYEGGEFSIFRGRYQVKLGKGDLMIFPADPFWVHGTNPVTIGARYAVNSFLHPDISMYKESQKNTINKTLTPPSYCEILPLQLRERY